MNEHLAILPSENSAFLDEKRQLYPKAAFSTDHCRKQEEEADYRLPYKRDVDRIVHSKAYARYVDKTQVVYLVDNDHITHRSLHVQLVSNFARGLAEKLRLNTNLVEAIALGHDVGHPPFGHEGEGYLSELSQEFGNGCFAHPSQSCRLFSVLEPLNLGFAVYDGFLCHDGGMSSCRIVPNFGKSWKEHEKEIGLRKVSPEENIMPATLEGALVKICDTVSYLGKDIEDAIEIGILTRQEIPETCLGVSNRQMLRTVAEDLLKNSQDKPYIEIGQEVYDALKVLRKFNFDRIYRHPKLKGESVKIKRSYRLLFETLLKEYEKNPKESFLWNNYLLDRNKEYLEKTAPVQLVIDYIAGMTDNFFIKTLKSFYIPSDIEIA